jgi:desulfoferrodoxin (superoxide reductase-like protein)
MYDVCMEEKEKTTEKHQQRTGEKHLPIVERSQGSSSEGDRKKGEGNRAPAT